MLAPLLAAAALLLTGSPPVSDIAGPASPNARWIMFSRDYTSGPGQSANSLFVVTIDGKHLRRLAGPIYSLAFITGWTPDNLAIVTSPSASTEYVRPLTGRVVRPAPAALSASALPSFSPNGRYVAYADKGSLYVAAADGSSPRRVARSPAGYFVGGPSWSPDSSRLAYGTAGAGGSPKRLEVVRRDGSHRVRIAARSVSGFSVSWAPDGRRFAFGAQPREGKSHYPHLYVVNADGSGLRLLEPGDAATPHWSPHGDWIAYSRTQHSTIADVGQIVLRHPDGSAARVVKTVADAHGPEWLPDGRRLVVTAAGSCPASGVYVIGIDGSHARRLTNRC
jgi:Tol biopolymer transport system component